MSASPAHPGGADCSNCVTLVHSMIDEDSLPAAPINDNSATLKNRLWRYGPPIVWATLIFIGSSDLLSASHTSGFIIGPLHLLFPRASEATLASIHFALRKLGHFTEYAILAWLLARAIRTSSQDWLRKRWFWMALSFVVCYALFDEFRQSFVPSRTASIYDSLIDISGGLTALLMIRIRSLRNTNSNVSPSPVGRGSG